MLNFWRELRNCQLLKTLRHYNSAGNDTLRKPTNRIDRMPLNCVPHCSRNVGIWFSNCSSFECNIPIRYNVEVVFERKVRHSHKLMPRPTPASCRLTSNFHLEISNGLPVPESQHYLKRNVRHRKRFHLLKFIRINNVNFINLFHTPKWLHNWSFSSP